jgi:hypothetical protein
VKTIKTAKYKSALDLNTFPSGGLDISDEGSGILPDDEITTVDDVKKKWKNKKKKIKKNR